MRRFVLICMMLLLPVQWTWAAAASYCGHEARATRWHVGHHQHEHKSSAVDASKSAKLVKAGDVDRDCSVCSLAHTPWCATHHTGTAPSLATTAPRDEVPQWASHIGDLPERPDWPLAA